MNFADLAEKNREIAAWREAHPGPLVWVTSVRPGRMFNDYTDSAPKDVPFTPHSWHYIGREMRGSALYRESTLANPFRPEGTSLRARQACIAQYAQWLGERFMPGTAQWRELAQIFTYACTERGIALGCWCAPLPCHGDVVVEAITKMYAAGWRPEEEKS